MTATDPASMQGSFRHMPGSAAQCSLSLHLSQTLIQYSAISGTFPQALFNSRSSGSSTASVKVQTSVHIHSSVME